MKNVVFHREKAQGSCKTDILALSGSRFVDAKEWGAGGGGGLPAVRNSKTIQHTEMEFGNR